MELHLVGAAGRAEGHVVEAVLEDDRGIADVPVVVRLVSAVMTGTQSFGLMVTSQRPGPENTSHF